MKLRNLNSVIHNFAHSLQSYDFTHSSKAVFDVLANAYCNYGISEIEFDFIDLVIKPETIKNNDSEIILSDYSEWLPQLAKSQNADSTQIEILKIKLSVDFRKYRHPPGMDYAVELEIKTNVSYKIKGMDIQEINISEMDVYGKVIMPDKLINELWTKK